MEMEKNIISPFCQEEEDDFEDEDIEEDEDID